MALQGTLETFTVPDVLRLLSTTKKTGLFALEGDRGTGKVWLDDGRIEGVTSDREHGGDIDAVLFDLLRFKTGAFRFVPDDVPPESSVVREDQDGIVERALDRAEQLLIEWREIESVVPSLDAWVRLLPELENESVTIDASLWSVLAVLGGGSTGRRVGADLDLGELDACRRLRDLVELGVAEVDTEFVSAEERMGLSMLTPAPMDPPPPPPPPVADDETEHDAAPESDDDFVSIDLPPFADQAIPEPVAEFEAVAEPVDVDDDESVLVDHSLSTDEVASLGVNLAGFVARPSEPEEAYEVPEVHDEHEHHDSPIDIDTSLNGSGMNGSEMNGSGMNGAGHDSIELESDEVTTFESYEDEMVGAHVEPEPVDAHDDADEFLSQLANLSPKAAAAIEATNGADDQDAPVMEQMVEDVEDAAGEGDEEINKNLLLKFLSSAKN